LAAVAEGAVKSRGVLFAQVYIDSVITKLKDSNESGIFETLKEWFSKADRSSLPSFVSSFVGPVLDVQGFVRGELSGKTIFLFEDRNRTKPLSLCYVVDSTESLDQIVKGKNYAVSLVKALKKVGLRWGILTNGSIWRLYYTKEKALFETFFQIDLGDVIENRNKAEVALFAHFFNVQSFLFDEKDKCHLDTFRQESEEATREIEEHLQNKIEDILGKICMGFIQSEGKKSYTEEQKRIIFDNSIYVLYRLLFILYAEARGFLPVQNPEYYEKSAAQLMEIVKEYHCKGIENPGGQNLWNVLSEVFNWVNQGNRALGIPPYNGGLFDDSEKPYLANHTINNAYLSEALFSLGFREKKEIIFPINYNDLSVRHLGGLYEGILEYQLFIAPERMVRRKEKNTYRFIPESQAGKITRNDVVIEKGEVYFSQSSGERKLTGSYYTPEYIVSYIVENSIQQYLVKIDQDLEALTDKLVKAHKLAIDDKERLSIEEFADSETLSFLNKRIFQIKVLDPAMGSGHFLVNVAYYLTNYIVESLNSTEWTNGAINTSPLWWRRQVVEKCIFGVDLNELATELAKLSLWLITADNKKPLTFLNHHLRTGNSLLGTKLDNLVVLPKDGQIDNLKKFQTTLYYQTFRRDFIPRVLKLEYVMDSSTDEIEDIEKKKDSFIERATLEKNLKIVADTWLSTFFGYDIGGASYQGLLNKASELKEVPHDERVEEIASAKKNSFFHWWLEFPEVFFSSIEVTSGFDIVIGNPPYIRIQALEEKQVRFFASTYGAATGNYDIYALFVERAFSLLKEGGILGFILPSKFINSDYGAGLRKSISANKSLSKIVDLKDFQVFEGASTYTCLLFLKKAKNDKFDYLEIKDKNTIAESGFFEPTIFKKSEQEMPTNEQSWVFVSDDYAKIINKIKKTNLRLGDISKNIFQGLITGADKLYFVNRVATQEEDLNGLTKIRNNYDSKEFFVETTILRKLLKGKEIHRWQVDWENMFIIYPYFVRNNNARLITTDELKTQFPKAYTYFLNYEIQLRQRENNRFKNETNWHQFGRLQNIDKFEQPKILTQVLASKNNFTYDEKGNYYFVGGGNAGGYGIVLENAYSQDYYWVLCLLNSRVLEFYLKRISTPFQSGFFSYGKRFIEQLPIIVPSQTDKDKLSELATKQLSRIKSISTYKISGADRLKNDQEMQQVDQEIDNLVYRIYGINESERQIIETSLNNG
jgi:hypothetical protein